MSNKVPHTMTVTENTTAPPPKLALNIQVLKTKDAALKFFEVLVAVICLVFFFRGDLAPAGYESLPSTFFFWICIMSCVMPTLLLLISYLMSPTAASLIPQTSFDFLTNAASSFFYLTTSVAFLIITSKGLSEGRELEKGVAVAVLGILNTILYLLSTNLSYQLIKSP